MREIVGMDVEQLLKLLNMAFAGSLKDRTKQKRRRKSESGVDGSIHRASGGQT